MKYIRATVPVNDANLTTDCNTIAGEMVNTMTGITYYVNGVLVDKPMPGYNTYTIDNIEFEVHPNMGCVMLLMNNTSIAPYLISQCSRMFDAIFTKFNKKAKIPVGMSGTTQYLCIDENAETKISDIKYFTDQAIQKAGSQYHFVWFIYNYTALDLSPLYVPYFTTTNGGSEYRRLSLSSIIYDDTNITELDNGYKGPDFPLLNKYSVYKKNLVCERPINVHYIYGIAKEIAKNFMQVDLKNSYYRKMTDNIFWLKWDNVKPRKQYSACIPWPEQIELCKQQELPYYDTVSIANTSDDISKNLETKEEIDKSTDPNEQDYRCFMTNIPIYEDCYVFDIYRQHIVEEIEVKDLDKYIKNGYTEYDKKEVVSAKKKKNAVIGTKAQNAKGKRGKKLTKKNTKSRKPKRNRNRNNSDEDNDNNNDNNSDNNSDNDNADNNGEDKSDNENDNTGGSLEEKKTAASTKNNKIYVDKAVNHKQPIHILISPYAMHCMNERLNGADIFKKFTDSEIIVYRTFCPRTCKQVINSLKEPDDSNMHFCSSVTDAYKNALHAFNEYINCVNVYNYESQYNGKTYSLFSKINMSHLLSGNNNKVLCLMDAVDWYSSYQDFC